MFTFLVILIMFSAVMVISSVKIVRQAEVAIVEKLGKYNKTLEPGINLVIPFLEKVVYRISLRTQLLESPPQKVITLDNVNVEINTVTFYRVVDPFKSVYEIERLQTSILNIIATTLRDVIGKMQLDDTYSSREEMNAKLQSALEESTSNWGIKIERVEVKDIQPPTEIREAMEKQMKAERERREVVLRAQGVKESQILEAEGKKEAEILNASAEKESQILRSEGEATAIIKIAEAERQRIISIYQAYNESELTKESLELQSILSMRELAKSDNKMLVPYESSAFLGAFQQIIESKSTKK